MASVRRKDKRTYLTSKSTVIILIAAALCFSVLGFFIYKTISSGILDKRKASAMDLIAVVSDELNREYGDKFEKITSAGDPEYDELLGVLSKYEKSSSVDYIYTMKMQGDELVFVVDADPSEENRALYGEKYPMTEDIEPAFRGEICCDKKTSSDKWGSYISAYAPVMNSQGKVVGIVGVDTKTDKIYREFGILRIQIILLVAAFFGICAAFLFTFWSSFAKKDLLTGIMNYDSLVEKGESLRRKGVLSDYSVIQLNIRNFKFINSKIGTSLGDILLIQYAGIISGHLEPGEYCARTGSDNFILLVKKGHEDDLIEKLSETWINLKAYGVSDLIQISIRSGIYEIDKNDSVQDSINYTSVALKNARLSNNNFIIRFEKSMLDSMVENNRIITDFRRAMSEGEFQVYYQPKVNISTNELCGAEALIRWVKDGNVISPAEFVPVLENEGLITEIDFFVFETVCQNICEWEIKGIKPVTISSNFSKINLANPNFADSVLAIMKKYSVDPDLLEVELTESSGYTDYEALIIFVEKMNHAKIRTSIDDFGTGYSSLSMLKDINVDVVKIDKSFLAKTNSDDIHQEKMLENVIQMINDLDRTVICEGIENTVQLDFLKKASCSVVQGFLFDRPLTHDEFELRLRSPHYSVDENGKITVETPEYEERWETVDLVEKPKDETVIVGKAKDTDDSDYSEIAETDKKPAPEPAVKSEPADTEKTETKPERKTEIDESAKAESFAMAKEKKKANKKQKNKSKNV
ncbi:MAG: EAL domain-containing protein [Oscillospiraceae bacterium]|nr:EAL domain-containing protein [Oscillospiraceae bacterium]MBR3534723.1 EAL domain-containing protein [Oscillospiraceae bacterium]